MPRCFLEGGNGRYMMKGGRYKKVYFIILYTYWYLSLYLKFICIL